VIGRSAHFTTGRASRRGAARRTRTRLTIYPRAKLRHSPEGGQVPRCDRDLRIGVFPTEAKPYHWGYLLGGLLAVNRFHLNRLIFSIAGRDVRKPRMAEEGIRHSMANGILELFHPFFQYTLIALGTTLSGEENLFRILKLNPTQTIRAFYIASGDDLHRFHSETGRLDTVRILEKGVKE
jgi:hypothetical protein